MYSYPIKCGITEKTFLFQTTIGAILLDSAWAYNIETLWGAFINNETPDAEGVQIIAWFLEVENLDDAVYGSP